MTLRFFLIISCLMQLTIAKESKEEQFLDSLTTQKAKTKKSKSSQSSASAISSNQSQFLANLSQGETYEQKEQEKEQQSQEQQAETDTKELSFLQNYYGNPDYKEAIKILHDTTMQETYNEVLEQMQMFFFNYTQNVLNNYHAPTHKSGGSQKSVSSFIHSLQVNKTTVPEAAIKSSLSSKSKISKSVAQSGASIVHAAGTVTNSTHTSAKNTDHTKSSPESTAAFLKSLEGNK